MKRTGKTAALFLSVLLLAGCSESSVETSPGETSAVVSSPETEDASAQTAEEETPMDSLEARQHVEDGLAEHDFGGETFRMLYQERYAEFQYAEELTGDTLPDAVYNRNVRVEDRFNVKLGHETDAEEAMAQRIMNSTLAGDDECDLFMGHSIYTGRYAVKGIFRNWYDLGVDFTKPWFPQYAIEHLTLNGRMFMTVSDVCLSLASNSYCYYFNKNGTGSAGFEDPYTVVKEGRWTIDYLMNKIASYYMDADGDGSVGSDDVFGFAGEKSNSTVAYLYSFEVKVLDVKEDGSFDMVFGNDERSVDAVDKLKKLLYASEGSYYLPSGELSNVEMFEAEKALFVTGVLHQSVTDFRDTCDFDYGIIPYPKYEEAQENYYTVAGGSISCCAVPLTVTRDELVGTVFTALAAETWKTVLPQYYDVVLKYKGARDETSISMIDIVLNGRNIDFEFIYDGFNGFIYKMVDILKNDTGLATYVAKNGKVVGKHYEKVLDLFFAEG